LDQIFNSIVSLSFEILSRNRFASRSGKAIVRSLFERLNVRPSHQHQQRNHQKRPQANDAIRTVDEGRSAACSASRAAKAHATRQADQNRCDAAFPVRRDA